MNFTLEREPYSYLQDGDVPPFTASDMICVMDARCSLCARGASWIARNDRDHMFTIIPMQTDLGAALLTHYGMNPIDPTSWLFLENGRAYSSIGAVIRVGQRLGGIWKGLGVLRVIPTPILDMVYRVIARNRYKVFGSTDMCAMPDTNVQERLLK